MTNFVPELLYEGLPPAAVQEVPVGLNGCVQGKGQQAHALLYQT